MRRNDAIHKPLTWTVALGIGLTMVTSSPAEASPERGCAPASSGIDLGGLVETVGALDIGQILGEVDVVACDLVGVPIELPGGLEVPIPAAGESVTIAVDDSGGTSQVETVMTDADGVLHHASDSHGAAGHGGSAALGLPPMGSPRAQPGTTETTSEDSQRCNDPENAAYGYRWMSDSVPFSVNGSERRPDGVSSATLGSTAGTAAERWNEGSNSCGLSGAPSQLNLVHEGSTSRDANISGSSCTARDGRNVVDWGPHSGSVYGVTCFWAYSSGEIVEFDLRMDSSDREYALDADSCSDQVVLIAGVMHEFGHATGMAHVTERGEGDLTMSPSTTRCDDSAALLGYGDHLGIMDLYG
ncbi:hypothetical protein [Ruania alba]|uniref:Matrixin family metalloprotease n=1 Tax=Ruania alba TaxID=648782 RepID=A0A1H5F723_9MICO|nr:hypothetical protein [Ruania alba]SED99083.1 hypothetical protein SAMN04488554_1248 [Ruania alba]